MATVLSTLSHNQGRPIRSWCQTFLTQTHKEISPDMVSPFLHPLKHWATRIDHPLFLLPLTSQEQLTLYLSIFTTSSATMTSSSAILDSASSMHAPSSCGSRLKPLPSSIGSLPSRTLCIWHKIATSLIYTQVPYTGCHWQLEAGYLDMQMSSWSYWQLIFTLSQTSVMLALCMSP